MLMAIPLTLLKKGVRGYQTRINRALRKLMKNEMKEEKKASASEMVLRWRAGL